MKTETKALALAITLGLGLLILGGCASIPEKGGFDDVQTEIADRTGQQVEWRQGGDADEAVDDKVNALLKKPLTPDAAVQIALLSNRHLQATYEALGVAQASLVQAGLLANPIFRAEVGFFQSENLPPNLLFGVTQSFLSILYQPLRKSIANAEFDAAKQRVTAAVVDLSAQVCSAYYRVQADLQTGELLGQTVKATAASFKAAQVLRNAGNTTRLQLYREQALHEQSRLLLAEAQSKLVADQEHLNRLMGAWNTQVAWHMDPRLPEIPEHMLDLTDLERRAISANLQLNATRADLLAAAGRAGITDKTALIPKLDLGAAAARDDGDWEADFSLDFSLPLFDQGQARQAKAYSDVRRLRQQYYAQAVDVRSEVRAAGHTLFNARQRALHVADVILPLRNRIVDETQQQVNAMQLGVFDLLTAQRQQINAGLDYVETRREYWTARTRLQQILNGSMPAPNQQGAGIESPPSLNTGTATGDH